MQRRPRATDGQDLTKIVIVLPKDAPTQEETLWAQRLGEQLYRLDNTPWYAMGCALDDVICCEENPGQLPLFVKVVRPSGNRTLRVFVPETAERSSTKVEIFKLLGETGCFFEEYGSSKGLIAVTIPSSTDLELVLARLNGVEAAKRAYWESGNF